MTKSFVLTAVYTTLDGEENFPTVVETSAHWEVGPEEVTSLIAQFTAHVHEKSGVGAIEFTYSEITA